MDNVMRDEVARLYPANASSDFENNVRREIIDWILLTTTSLTGMDMKDVIKMFWKEKLN